MAFARVSISLVTATVACHRAPSAQRPASELWIDDVTVISPERSVPLEHASVVVRGNRIVWIGRGIPPGRGVYATKIAGHGQFLIPGLIDGHVHLADVPGVNPDAPPAQPVIDAYFAQLPRSYLYFGFTTVVDLSVIDRQQIEMIRRAPLTPMIVDCDGGLPVANGYPMVLFPPAIRFAAFANFLTGRDHAIPPGYLASDHTPRAAVARVAKAGGVCVKTYFEPGRARALPVPTVAMIEEVVSEAHLHRLPVLLHANSLAAHQFAVATRVDAVAHGLFHWDSDQPDALAAVHRVLDDEIALGMRAMVTSRVVGGLVDLFDAEFLSRRELAAVVPAELLAWYRTPAGRWFADPLEPLRAQLAGLQADGARAAKYFVDHGGRLLFGSDTPSDGTYANPPGYNGYLELRELEASGISPQKLLDAATRTNAEFFGLGRELGTIEIGKRANLLVVRNNPLASTAAFTTIEWVIVDGKPIRRTELAAPLQPKL